MIRKLRQFWKDRRGASAVEFALLIGPFLLLTCGTFEFGRMMWTREALQSTAITGARCMGMLESSCASSGAYSSSKSLTYVIAEAATLKVSLTASNVTLTNSTSCAGVSGFSEVTLSYNFQSALPYFLNAFTGGYPLSATACFPNQS